jgi:hypothetical protein
MAGDEELFLAPNVGHDVSLLIYVFLAKVFHPVT